MNLPEMLSRSTSPNADVECFAAGDEIATGLLAVAVDANRLVRMIGADAAIGAAGSCPPAYLGHVQNAPAEGSPALVRVAGFTPVIYGDSVSAFDILRLDPSTGKLVPFDVTKGDGHSHAATLRAIRRVVFVCDDAGAPILTGAASLSSDLRWDDSDAFATAPETVTISEISGGEYLVEFVPSVTNRNYVLRVARASGGIVSPAEFQVTSHAKLGAASVSSIQQIAGIALVSGENGDEGLMLIGRQIF